MKISKSFLTIIYMAVGLLSHVNVHASANKLELQDIVVHKGETKATLPVLLSNENEIAGFQCDLYLPEGIEVGTDKNGNFLAELNRTSNSRHNISARLMSDGALRLLCTSTTNATFSGNNGAVLNIALNVNSSLATGKYTIALKNIVLTDPKASRYTSENTSSILSVVETVTVTYQVKYESKVVATATAVVAKGSALPSVPAELSNSYITLVKSGTHPQTVTRDVTVTFLAQWNGPFQFSKTVSTATWYNMHIRSGWYVGKQDTEPYYPAQVNETERAKATYQWAFGGDPYHVKVYNRTTGFDETLTMEGENAVMRPGEYTWDLLPNSDGFVLRVPGTENTCINQFGGNGGPLKFWTNGSSLTDDGSTFRVEKIDIPITITAKSYTITYGEAVPSFGYTVSGGTMTGQPSIACSAGSKPAVGTYDIVVSKGSVTNSNVTYVKGTLTVNKAPLKASVGNYSRKQGENNPTFKITYSGFKYNETEDVLTKKATAACSATASSAPGTYPITLSGASAKNYDISYQNGVLTVTQADAITITAKNYTITYGEAVPTLSYTVSGGTLKGQPSITCNAGSKPAAGTYEIIVSKGSVTNPNVTYVKGTLTVNKAPLKVSVGNYSRKQGEDNPTFKITYSGFKYNETESVLTTKATAVCQAKSFSPPGTYPITLSGASAKNYDISYQDGVLTVTQADPITVTAKNYTITYGEAVPSLGYTVSGGTLSGRPTITCSAGSKPAAGTYDIIVSKGSVTNPNVTYVKGTLTVNKAPLKVSVGNYSRKQGEDNPTFKITYSGFKYNETESVLTTKATAVCQAKSYSPPGTYPITLTKASATNYDFSYQNGVLTVTPADAITITANNYTITYGEAVPNLGYTVNGGTLTGQPSITCSAGSKPAVGTYEIKVEKGTASNYGLVFVNGTLTVNPAELTVTASSYVKYKDEDNPTFELNYQGFKYGETERVLTQVPQVSCEATKYSPSGEYPITLYGGKADNYSFKYVNGMLTIKNIFDLSITPIGNGAVKYNNNTINEFSKYKVKEDEDITLHFIPNADFHLSELLQNGQDVTANVINNAYTIPNINQDIQIIATFSENAGNFTVNGINYITLSAPNKTVKVDKGNYSGHITIPESITNDGQVWIVKGIVDNAFNHCTGLISLAIPGSMNQSEVGISLLTGCSQLAAITWDPGFPLTNEMLGAIENPNLLFYAKSKSYAPSYINNVIVNGKADNIILKDVVDGIGNFYCPTEFTAANISYSHRYSMESAIDGSQGWETIALPFTVQQIKHSREGDIVPFAKYNASQLSQRPFWLYGYGENGFVRASIIEANQPYIICMPNNEEYETEYCLNGDVTFSAQNAPVLATNIKGVSGGRNTFIPVFCEQQKSSNIYALNVNNSQHSEVGSYRPGSRFIKELRTVSPFEAFMTSSSSYVREFIYIDFEGTTGIDEIITGKRHEEAFIVYNMAGIKIATANSQEELDRKLRTLPGGTYIINKKKILIK